MTPQRGDDAGLEFAGVLGSDEDGAVVLLGHLHALGEGLHAVADHERGDVELHEALEGGKPLGVRKRVEVCALDAADDLDARGVEVVVKAGELHRRAVDVVGHDLLRLVVPGGVQDLQAVFLRDGPEQDGVFASHKFPPGKRQVFPYPILLIFRSFGNDYLHTSGCFCPRGFSPRAAALYLVVSPSGRNETCRAVKSGKNGKNFACNCLFSLLLYKSCLSAHG